MMHIDAETIKQQLGWQETIEALRSMFREGCEVPPREHHIIQNPGREDATLLLMPAWISGSYAGLKTVTVNPDNAEKGLPTITGTYELMDGQEGVSLATLDAAELTARRTVCASALASDYLSRKDATNLLIVGSGRLARYLGFAHAAVRPINKILVWARDVGKAEEVAAIYGASGYDASAAHDLEKALAKAHIVSAATLATDPLILGEWLRPGTHVDLIGGFKPSMREADDKAVARSSVFVDTREGALQEAGDLITPIHNGVLSEKDIAAELSELCSGEHLGRSSEEEITLFKSVGTALEDLAAGILVYESTKH